MESNKRIDLVVDYLLGTCSFLDQALQVFNIDALTDDEENYLFSEIFCCDSCGWWSETCEANNIYGELICDDCFLEGF